jgi:DNA mismatch repair protein MutS
VLFLHRLVAGGANRSYGIEVGRLAGLPEPVLQRARALLSLFEREQIVSALGRKGERKGKDSADQLPLFGSLPSPIVEELKTLDANAMTPIEALTVLNRLVERARQA